MTLQECKDQIAQKHYYSEWSKLCPNGNLEGVPDKWIDEVAELYASQFKSQSEAVGEQKPDEQEDVALETLLDTIDSLYLISFNKKLIGTIELEAATRASVLKYASPLQARIKELEQEKEGWISVKERPLITKDEKGRWTCTKDGDQEFIAAIQYHEIDKGDFWWIRHCVIEDQTGLCVVGDDDNEPAGWSIEDVEFWQPLPSPPEDEQPPQP